MIDGLTNGTNPAILLLCLAFAAPAAVTLVGLVRPRAVPGVAIATTALAFLAVLWAYTQPDATFDHEWVPTLGYRFTLTLDGLAREYALLATGIGLAVVIYASVYIPLHLHHPHRSETELPRFFGFLLLFMAAMVGLVMAQDMILIFIFWDLTAIASFYLIGYDRDDPESRNSAMMALLVTGITAIFVLIGLLILRRETGTFSLPEIIARPGTSDAMGLGIALICLGAIAKSAQVPFHFWLPKAMAAPTPVSAYLHSAAMVAAGVFLIGRFEPLVDRYAWLTQALLVVGAASMVIGGVLALTRDVLKQVLAYSTISQYGYIVAMYGLGGHYGFAGVSLYVLAHALAKSALFLTAGSVTESTGAKKLSEVGGLFRSQPVLAIASAASAAGMIGLPATLGFFKDELFFAAGSARGVGYAVLTVAGAALTFTYISRFWISIFLGEPKGEAKPLPARLLWPVGVLGFITIVGGIWTVPFTEIAQQAASVIANRTEEVHVAYHLDTRAENIMAVSAWVAGITLLLTRRFWWEPARAFARHGERIGPERIYRATLAGIERLSDALHRFEVRDLRSRVATIFFPAGVLVGLAVIVTPNSDAFEIGAIHRGDIPLITIIAATVLSGLAVTIPRDHLRLAITLSCVGFSLCVIYAFMGAPDVALVAVLVETLFSLIFLGMLLLMPRRILRYESQPRSKGRHMRRDVVLASIAGAMAFLVAWGALSRTSENTEMIDTQAALTPLAHGKAVVTVVLADFRGFDTMGEITVIAITLLGILSLIRSGRMR
ncbi:MAG: hydrogen gas-evolving membrane-bound hydrogenase subunit E [Thermomicrobiales bacterium]